jgi:hypothetical protein
MPSVLSPNCNRFSTTVVKAEILTEDNPNLSSAAKLTIP